jgi:transcriptional/translational regulatory protein YebC/TACO1
VRHAFTRHGGNLGEQGSVAWQFSRKGLIVVEKAYAPDEDALMEVAIEAGAEDLIDSESSWDIVTEPGDFQAVQGALERAGIPVLSAGISMIPTASVPVAGGEARQVLQLIEALEDLDDVQNVYANFDIPDEVMASL